MMVPDPEQFLLQLAVACVAISVLLLVGRWVWTFFESEENDERQLNEQLFFSLLVGLITVVTIYSIVISRFATIHVLIPLVGLLCIPKRKGKRSNLVLTQFNWKNGLEIFLLALFFTSLFNFFPEGEYKQRDSFFYLKISEALNATGQENTNQYYNIYSTAFHGIETYHYFECWLNALLIRFTNGFLPNIQTFRIVTYTIVSVIFIFGLYHIFESVARKKMAVWQKLFCISFVFFMPDMFQLLPESMGRYLVFNFENNFIERPNFRLIYVFIVPVISSLLKNRLDKTFIFFLTCFCIINPTVMVTVVPALVIGLAVQYTKRINPYPASVIRNELLIFSLFILAYFLFYYFFSNKVLPPVFTNGFENMAGYFHTSWKFILLTIVTSTLYVAFFIAVAWLIAKKFAANEFNGFVQQNKLLLFFIATLIIAGIIVARIGGFLENMYQVAYNSYITASLLIFVLVCLPASKSWKYALPGTVVFIAGFVLCRTTRQPVGYVFRQNDRHTYQGLSYSDEYIKEVTNFAEQKKFCVGAYIADSSYYAPLYYSLRNPNVYHLPMTYIMAEKATVTDFCLSDPRDIKYDARGKFKQNAYLDNAIARSYYHRDSSSFQLRDAYTLANMRRFIQQNKLQYLILTPGVQLDSIPGLPVRQKFFDPVTKERFWIF